MYIKFQTYQIAEKNLEKMLALTKIELGHHQTGRSTDKQTDISNQAGTQI